MTEHLLVINAGSSTLKFAGYTRTDLHCLYRGILDGQGSGDEVELRVHYNGHSQSIQFRSGLTLQPIFQWLQDNAWLAQIVGVGHRVVHGGQRFSAPVRIDQAVLAAIAEHAVFAPLHNPVNLRVIEGCAEQLGDITQIAVFDTAFHQTLPPHAYLYALPYDWYQQRQVRRYGFHGISHAYVAEQAAQCLQQPLQQCRLVTLHLGNGCSACAVDQGRSVDTTMGLTPMEGLMMGTRCGNLDPGLAQFLCHELALDIDQLTHVLNRQSGLLGVSQLSSDMRTLVQAAEQGNLQASLAIEMFCYRAARCVAEMLVPLGSLDALVFTGGIGEHSSQVRARILHHLRFLGLELDAAANAVHGDNSNGVIASSAGKAAAAVGIKALVIATNEEKMIARQSLQLIEEKP